MWHLAASQQPSKWRCAMHFMYYSTRMLCATHSCAEPSPMFCIMLHARIFEHIFHICHHILYIYCMYMLESICTYTIFHVHVSIQFTCTVFKIYVAIYCTYIYIFSYIVQLCVNISVSVNTVYCPCDKISVHKFVLHIQVIYISVHILTMHISMEMETQIMYVYIHAPSIHHI